MSNKNLTILVSVSLVLIASILAILIYNQAQRPKIGSEVATLTKKIETPVKDEKTGEYKSKLIDFKVKTEKDKFTITYPRGKFTSDELADEITKILKQTDMSEPNMLSVGTSAIMNDTFYLDTQSECGFTEPSSAWCFQLKNNKESGIVTIKIQKGLIK